METLTFLLTSTFYPPFHIGGDAVHVKYLADELARLGHEVHVLHSLDAYNVKRKKMPEKATLDDVYLHPIKTMLNLSAYEVYGFGNSRSCIKLFKKIVSDIKPDVVHHHNISLLGYSLLKKASNYRNLYTAHDYWLFCQQNNLFKNGMEKCSRRTCFSCALKRKKSPQLWRRLNGFKAALDDIDVLIAPSSYLKDELFAFLGREVILLPNFVPKLLVSPEKSGFDNFFLYAGALEPHKGVLDLLNAYKEVCNETDAQLLIAGDGSLSSEIKQFVEKYSLGGKVVILGRVENALLYRLLRDANALVLPSRWPENSPLITLEALSLSTPVIASDKGGLPEIVEKLDKELIYNSPNDLSTKLASYSKSKYPLSLMKVVSEQYYSPEAFLKKYLHLCQPNN